MLILTTVNARSVHDTLYSRAIRLWCWSKYNHTAEWEYNTETKETRVRDAVSTFRNISLLEWLKHYTPLEFCNMNYTYKITQDECQKTVNVLESFVGTDYGEASILGLGVKAFTGLKLFGINGIKRLICSEATMRAWLWLIQRFAIVKFPLDYITPTQRGKYFKMKKFDWVTYAKQIEIVIEESRNG